MNSDVIDINQAAEMLAVSAKTIRRNLKEIPHGRVGNKLLFSRDALIALARGVSPKQRTQPRAYHPKADF